MSKRKLPTPPSARTIRSRLHALADADAALHAQGFFKTGPGQYGEGDIFLGVRVPVLRGLVKEFAGANLDTALELLAAPHHEERLLALLLMVRLFERGDDDVRQAVYDAYRKNLGQVNNWDLVDSSAPQIVGEHLAQRSRRPLHLWAKSRSLWSRRVAIVATHAFIQRGDFADTFLLADVLLNDPEDLIHKAVGWMLREAGKRDPAAEEAFLLPRYRDMPRTMLRYAIERFPPERRRQYLLGEASS